MARPAKSVKVKSGAIASAEAEIRTEVEEHLRGTVKPEPPEHLTEDQAAIFDFIVEGLESADILGRMDVFVLESTAIAIDRLRQINRLVNDDIDLLRDSSLQSTRAKLQSDLWRGCNELCLSTQARAKLGSIAAQAAGKKKDPLLEALSADD